MALAFAIRDALRSGDLYLAESRHHVSFWNLVQSSEQWAERRASAYIELSLPTEPEQVLDRLRTELDDAAHRLSDGLDHNPFARIEAGELMLSRRDALEISTHVRELRGVIESHLPRIRIEDLLVLSTVGVGSRANWLLWADIRRDRRTFMPRYSRP